MCGSGVKIPGMKITTERPLTEVLGYMRMLIKIEGYYAAVPGTAIQEIAVPRLASTTAPTSTTTILGFGLCASFRGLSSPLHFSPFALCSVFFSLVPRAARTVFLSEKSDHPLGEAIKMRRVSDRVSDALHKENSGEL